MLAFLRWRHWLWVDEVEALLAAHLNVLLGLAVVAGAILATLALTARRDDW
jgi:hypothetical protein